MADKYLSTHTDCKTSGVDERYGLLYMAPESGE